MLLQIASFEEDPAAIEEGARHAREEVVPSIQGAEGLVAAYWAIDRQNGKRVSIMLWQSLEGTAATLRPRCSRFPARRRAGSTPPPSRSSSCLGVFETALRPGTPCSIPSSVPARRSSRARSSDGGRSAWSLTRSIATSPSGGGRRSPDRKPSGLKLAAADRSEAFVQAGPGSLAQLVGRKSSGVAMQQVRRTGLRANS